MRNVTVKNRRIAAFGRVIVITYLLGISGSIGIHIIIHENFSDGVAKHARNKATTPLLL